MQRCLQGTTTRCKLVSSVPAKTTSQATGSLPLSQYRSNTSSTATSVAAMFARFSSEGQTIKALKSVSWEAKQGGTTKGIAHVDKPIAPAAAKAVIPPTHQQSNTAAAAATHASSSSLWGSRSPFPEDNNNTNKTQFIMHGTSSTSSTTNTSGAHNHMHVDHFTTFKAFLEVKVADSPAVAVAAVELKQQRQRTLRTDGSINQCSLHPQMLDDDVLFGERGQDCGEDDDAVPGDSIGDSLLHREALAAVMEEGMHLYHVSEVELTDLIYFLRQHTPAANAVQSATFHIEEEEDVDDAFDDPSIAASNNNTLNSVSSSLNNTLFSGASAAMNSRRSRVDMAPGNSGSKKKKKKKKKRANIGTGSTSRDGNYNNPTTLLFSGGRWHTIECPTLRQTVAVAVNQRTLPSRVIGNGTTAAGAAANKKNTNTVDHDHLQDSVMDLDLLRSVGHMLPQPHCCSEAFFNATVVIDADSVKEYCLTVHRLVEKIDGPLVVGSDGLAMTKKTNEPQKTAEVSTPCTQEETMSTNSDKGDAAHTRRVEYTLRSLMVGHVHRNSRPSLPSQHRQGGDVSCASNLSVVTDSTTSVALAKMHEKTCGVQDVEACSLGRRTVMTVPSTACDQEACSVVRPSATMTSEEVPPAPPPAAMLSFEQAIALYPTGLVLGHQHEEEAVATCSK